MWYPAGIRRLTRSAHSQHIHAVLEATFVCIAMCAGSGTCETPGRKRGNMIARRHTKSSDDLGNAVARRSLAIAYSPLDHSARESPAIAAWAATSRAMGTRKGEQLT